MYVDDIPSPPNCLHGAFIYSEKPLAWIRDIDVNYNSKIGVSSVLSFKDIPQGGENIGSGGAFGSETLFADDVTRYAGERIALVVTPCF